MFPGALELLERIRKNSGEYVFFTNNSSISTADYFHKIQRLGIPCKIDNVATSTQALIIHIRESYPDARFYVMGTASMKAELRESGLLVVDRYQEDIDGVVIGYDTELVYQKLIDVSRLLTQNPSGDQSRPCCPLSSVLCPIAHRSPSCWKMRRGDPGSEAGTRHHRDDHQPLRRAERRDCSRRNRLYRYQMRINADRYRVGPSGETTVQDLESSEFQPTLSSWRHPS